MHMAHSEKKFSNLPSDWRLQQPPKGDWRFLGHPSHDARGHLKKHSQFSPWVLHCMCGKIHELPKKPELKIGLTVMVHAIDPRSPHAELNGYEGRIRGPPDRDGCYPIHLTRSGEIVLLPKSTLKVQVFTDLGTQYDGRVMYKEKKKLPPLPPAPVAPKKPQITLGVFLRNFRMFVKEGIQIERYEQIGPLPTPFPQLAAKRIPTLFWMNSAMKEIWLGSDKKDPYKQALPLVNVQQIICWEESEPDEYTAGSRTSKGPSMSKDLSVMLRSEDSGGTWAEMLESQVTSYIHLRLPSEKSKHYVSTCLSALCDKPIIESPPPPDRSFSTVLLDPPPLGKPKDHQKALLHMKEAIQTKLNWSPYVALRRFNKIETDAQGYVVKVNLPEAGADVDLSEFGNIIGERLLELNLYFNEHVTGDLTLMSCCPSLEVLNLGNCPNICGSVNAFVPCKNTLRIVDLHWCNDVCGSLNVFEGAANLVELNLSGLSRITGRIDMLRKSPLLEVVQITGPLFRGDIKHLFQDLPKLRIVSFEGCRDIIGDISAVKYIPNVEELRFTGCKRLTGDVACFLVPAPPPLPPTFQRKKSLHFDSGQETALHYLGSKEEGEGEANMTIAMTQGLAPMSLSALMGLDKNPRKDRYALYDNRYHGPGTDPRPFGQLREISLHDCGLVEGDAAVFASIPKLGKLTLWRTKVELSEAYGGSKEALENLLPPKCSLLF